MINYKISNFQYIFTKEINIFRAGLFILPSAPVIAFLLIIISLLINSFKIKASYFKNKSNFLICITGLLMLISSIFQTFFLNNSYSKELNEIKKTEKKLKIKNKLTPDINTIAPQLKTNKIDCPRSG